MSPRMSPRLVPDELEPPPEEKPEEETEVEVIVTPSRLVPLLKALPRVELAAEGLEKLPPVTTPVRLREPPARKTMKKVSKHL